MADPLHGITLAALLEALVERYGWEELGRRVPIRCFLYEPTLKSSLKFLRKTPWARSKVERLYIEDARVADRKRRRNRLRADQRAFARMTHESPGVLALTWPPDALQPMPELPAGYSVDLAGERSAFEAVQREAGAAAEGSWDELACVPGSMILVRSEDRPVAAAVAVQREDGWVAIRWVAVVPEHRGRGLGRAVTAALVGMLCDAGHRHIVGTAPETNLNALRIGLDLGFRTVERPDDEVRWAEVFARLG